MTKQSDEVFVLEGEHHLTSLRVDWLQYDGKPGEEALQTLIEKHPEVLPGKQIDPNSKDQLRFVLLCREMPVGDWSLDLLLVDQKGILTLVETKLAKNSESRREVIGQILEYAANAAKYWGNGRARNIAKDYWAKKQGQNVDEAIRTKLEKDEVEDFWNEVDENLQGGQIRLIVAGDEIRPEVRRIIEYLNEEMKNAKIYGLELRCYRDESGTQVIVPHLIGQTQATADRKETTKPTTLWTADLLRDTYEKMENTGLGIRLRKVLDWAIDQGFFLELTRQNPGFGLRGRSGQRIASFYPVDVWCDLNEKKYRGGAQERDQLVAELKELGMYGHDLDPEGAKADRNLIRKLTDLSEDDFRTLLDIFSRFCAKAESTS